jgi:hypothetical protein
MSVPLHTILKSGYSNDPNQQATDLAKFNYVRDDALSNQEHQVYFHPEKGIIYNINGTSKPSDWMTNAQIALGIKTQREKNERKNIERTKQKYGVDNATITGSSLGGFLSSQIAKKNDKVYTYNKASLPFTPIKNNETHYRTSNDLVSLPTFGTKHTKTISNVGRQSFNPIKNILDAHSTKNLKNKNIKV